MKLSYRTYIHTYTHTLLKKVYITKGFTIVLYAYFSSNALHYGTYFITDVFCNICGAVHTKRCLWEVNRIRCTTGMCKFVYSMEVKELNWPCVSAGAGQNRTIE
jgi:hypothetical protein